MCIYKERESSGCQNIGAEERGFLRNYISAYIIKDSRIGDSNYIYICLMISLSNSKSRVSRIPVVPHKAVAEVSKIGNL